MVASDVVQIGPFSGGLNTYSDPTAVLDNEVVMAENLELDLDGSLVSRPPFTRGPDFPLGASGNMLILGYFFAANSTPYLIASDGLSSTYYFTGTSWVLITNTFAASALTQYNNLAYLQAPLTSTNPGGSWSPSAGFTAINAMPKGNVIIAHKSRLWAASGLEAGIGQNGTRIYLSKIADPTTWDGTFIDIGPGDGQNIVKIIKYFDDLLIFKAASIYRFAFSTDPATGAPSQISPTIGLASRDSAVTSDSIVYFVYADKVYQISNYQVTQINQKVPLVAGTTTNNYYPVSIGVFNNRLIVSYYDTMFVYSLRTQRWTTWKSTAYGSIGRIVELNVSSTSHMAIAHSAAPVAPGSARTAKTLVINDALSATPTENFTCTLVTKNYDYQAPSMFKRMFYWGADVVFRGQLKAYASSIRPSSFPTWDQLLTTTWSAMLSYNWNSISAGDSGNLLTQVDTSSSSSLRRFVKLGSKSFRFRQAYFRLVFSTDGTTPVRIFALITRVSTKQTVSKQVS
jgi:hypothetical protein